MSTIFNCGHTVITTLKVDESYSYNHKEIIIANWEDLLSYSDHYKKWVELTVNYTTFNLYLIYRPIDKAGVYREVNELGVVDMRMFCNNTQRGKAVLYKNLNRILR